jgi:hypothetical protein
MVWTGTGAASPEAHNSIGVTEPSNSWYMPEGSSNHGFETWTTVQNPNGAEAALTITYMTEVREKQVTKKLPRTEGNTHEPDIAPTTFHPGRVGPPAIAEKSVYRNSRREGSCSIGATAPAIDFFLSEGSTVCLTTLSAHRTPTTRSPVTLTT